MDIISIYNRIILHEQAQKEKSPAQDCNWKPARCEDYTLPPFQIPKNRSKKSQREQLSKVLAFVKYERNIRAAEGCTVMPDNEKQFEQDIESFLISSVGGWQKASDAG